MLNRYLASWVMALAELDRQVISALGRLVDRRLRPLIERVR